MKLTLHNFFRSSTSIRVRIALNLKGLDYDYVAYSLRAGDHRSEAYLALNPQGLVPALEAPLGVLSQSLAIIEWLDETHPAPALLPEEPWQRAQMRSLAHHIALDVHPINNLRVLFRLRDQFGASEADQRSWFTHWVEEAFAVIEKHLSQTLEDQPFCHGETPGLADICLAAQVINNERFGIPRSDHPNIERVFDACMALPAFANAHPSCQSDALG